jgi:hypothetical protein
VTRIESSSDKKEIFVGTSFGRVAVLCAKTFEVFGIFINSLESPVTDITTKNTSIIVGY